MAIKIFYLSCISFVKLYFFKEFAISSKFLCVLSFQCDVLSFISSIGNLYLFSFLHGQYSQRFVNLLIYSKKHFLKIDLIYFGVFSISLFSAFIFIICFFYYLEFTLLFFFQLLKLEAWIIDLQIVPFPPSCKHLNS